MNNDISWEQVAQLSKQLAKRIQASGFKPDCLMGITVGGLIPLGLLAEELDIRNVVTISARSYSGREKGELEVRYLPTIDLKDKRVLLIDEVAETGTTLKHVVNLVNEKYQPSELRTATLGINKASSQFRPDFCGLEANEWVTFPWEKE